MRLISILFFGCFLTSPLYSQRVVKQVSVSLNNIRIERANSSYQPFTGNIKWTDTVLTGFFFSLNKIIPLAGFSVSNDSNFSESTNNSSSHYIRHVNIGVDTNANQITSVNLDEDYGSSWMVARGTTMTSYTQQSMSLSTSMFNTTSNGDTLTLLLDNLQLETSNLKYYERKSSSLSVSSENHEKTRVLGYPNGSYLRVSVVLSDPTTSSVHSDSQSKPILSINSISKEISFDYIPGSERMECYDIIGKSHHLAFVRMNDRYSVYSFNNLRSGFYIIRIGYKSVKIFIP